MVQNSPKVKTCYRLFMAWQEEKETRWLENMSKQGWHLADVKLIQYIFIQGEPKDVIYKLDYKTNRGADFDDYVALFQDSGWEYVAKLHHWIYFRADANKMADQDIYTDNQSRIQKYKSLLKILIIACWPSFYFSFVWFPIFGLRRLPHSAALEAAYLVCFCVSIFMVYSIVRIYLVIRKLQKMPQQ